MAPEEYERHDIEVLNEVAPYCFESDREEQWFKVGLQYGLDAADKEPLIQWISVDEDLPCNHNELICSKELTDGTETIDVFAANQYGHIWSDCMVYENGNWRWNDFEPRYWMIAPKVPK